MTKQTKLDDQAIIYQPRSEQTEKEKLKDMSFKKKLAYLWEYYKIHAIIVIIVISLIYYIINNILTPDVSPQFNAAVINNSIPEDVWEEYKVDFGEYLQIDPERESIEFNTSFYFNNDSEFTMNMQQVLTTYIAAEEIDVLIAPESELHKYAYYGYMAKLSDALPTDVYSSLTDNFYITDLEDDAEKNVYGIYLSDTTLFKNNTNPEDPYILGIIVNYPHTDNTVEFIRYLFQE
jgi:hypothetical protein